MDVAGRTNNIFKEILLAVSGKDADDESCRPGTRF